MIEISKLRKTFGLRPVLRGVDLHIERAECVALLGANGSGKTTLLRILAGLSRPTSGEARIGGWLLPKEAAQIRAHLGYLGHLPLIYDDLTVEENLRFFARLYRADASHIPALLERVGLARRAKDRAGTFSRGMAQRLGLARALLHAPDVLLFDEPYTGLDVDGAAMLDGVIREQRDAGRTILLTTHDLPRTLALCTRVVILNRGAIMAQAPVVSLTADSLMGIYTEAVGLRPAAS